MGARQTPSLRIRDLRIGSNAVDEPPRTETQRRSAYASAVAPLRAASIAAMSILRMVIMASIARLAASRLGSAMASSNARGVICHEKPPSDPDTSRRPFPPRPPPTIQLGVL